MITAILDANVLVSAVLTPKGHPAKILREWRAGSFDLVTSLSLLKEMQRVISYPKIRKRLTQSDVEVNELLLGLAQFSIMVYGEPQINVVKEDPTDNKYLACAQKGEVDFIVTGDQHWLKLQDYKGTKIVTPREFLNVLKKV